MLLWQIIYTIFSKMLEDKILTLCFSLKSILYSVIKVSSGFLCLQNFTVDQVTESQVTHWNQYKILYLDACAKIT